jgi:hypothetical protein
MRNTLKILLAFLMIVAFILTAVACKAKEDVKKENELGSEALENLENALDEKAEELLKQAKEQEKENKDLKKKYKENPTEPAAEMTFEDIIEVYKAEGVEVDLEDKPLFNTYGSINAVVFYVERVPTYFYEYICEEMVSDCTEQMEFCRTFGRFAIKTYGDRAKEIFDSLGDTNNTEPPEVFPDPDEEAADVTLEEIAQAFIDKGIEVDMNKKPLYHMIRAKNGILFDYDRFPVKIYEFGNAKLAEENQRDFFSSVIGRFVLETKKEEAIEVFNSFKSDK